MKIKHLFIGLLAVTTTIACQQEEPVATPLLELNKEAVSLAAKDAEAQFTITTNQSWEATADVDWIVLDPANGKASDKAIEVTITAENNEIEEARTAKITVTAGTLSETIQITQAAADVEDEPQKPDPVVPASEWALVGTFNDFDLTSDLYLSILNDEYFVYYAFELDADTEFKFVKGGAWASSGGQEVGAQGPVEPNTIQTAGQSYIKVTAAGKYDIYLSADNTKFYIMEEGKLPSEATEPTPVEIAWGLMGEFVDNSWVTDIPMTTEDGWTVAKGVQFDQIKFKIRANGSWADATTIGMAPNSEKAFINDKIEVITTEYSKANYSGSDCADIELYGNAGTYDIYFNFENLEIYVMEEGALPGEKEPLGPVGGPVTELYILGEATKIGWSTTTMEAFINNDGLFTWTGTIRTGLRYRFPLVEDWWPCLSLTEDGTSINYVTNDDEATFYNVPEDGIYTITLDLRSWNNRSATVEKVGEFPYSFTIAGSLNGGWNTTAENALMVREGDLFVARNVPMKHGSTVWGGQPSLLLFAIVETGTMSGYCTVDTEKVYDGTEKMEAKFGDANNEYFRVDLPEGNYDVYLDISNSQVWLEASENQEDNTSYTVAGSLNGGWNLNAENALMTREGDIYVARGVPMQHGSTVWGDQPPYFLFKIVETNTWNGYGNDGAVCDGKSQIDVVYGGAGNITVDLPEGNYDIYFDKANLKVWLEPSEIEPEYSYTISGSLNGGWNTSAENARMTLENGIYVAKNVPMQHGASVWEGQPNYLLFAIVETGTMDGYCTVNPEMVYNGTEPMDTVYGNAGANGHFRVDLPEGNYNIYFDKENLKIWLEAASN